MENKFVKNSPQFDEKFFNLGDCYLVSGDVMDVNVSKYYGILIKYDPLELTFKILNKTCGRCNETEDFSDITVPICLIVDESLVINKLVKKKESELKDSSLF